MCSCDGGCPRCQNQISAQISAQAKEEISQSSDQYEKEADRVAVIHPKLTIGQPNDKYEQEADRVADHVMRMPAPLLQRQAKQEEEEGKEEELIMTKPQITPLVQRQIEPEEEAIQPKNSMLQKSVITPDAGSNIKALQGRRGSPLPENLRAFFEPRFGTDFSKVRIHTYPQAGETAKKIRSRAFTLRENIFLGPGQYAPQTLGGKKLLAHELTHVMQQHTINGKAVIRRTPDPRSLRETIVVHSLSQAEIQNEINLINEWIRNNPRNEANESTHLILEAALERLNRPFNPPQNRRSSGPVRATGRTIRNIGSSSEPEVVRGRVRTAEPRVPQGTEGRSAERAAERAARAPESFEHARRAFSASETETSSGVRVRSRLTVSSTQVQLQVPIERVSPQRVQELARQMGFRMTEWLARHGELQQTTAYPNRPVGVSRPQCGNCFAFFVQLAHHRGRTQVVNDTVATRYFHVNGEVIEVWNDGTRVRLEMSQNGRRVLDASVVPPQVRGASTPSGGSGAQRTVSRTSRVPVAIPQAARTTAQGPTSGGAGGQSRFGAGISAAGGGMALIMIANEILGPMGRILNLQKRNIQMGLARIGFWQNFTNEKPDWAVWDQSNRISLSQIAELKTGVFSGATFPYVVDINVQALNRVLPTKISNFNDFALFLDMAKSISAISEQPMMPGLPTAAERRIHRKYYVTVNGPTNSRRRYDITGIIDSVRRQAVAATNQITRSGMANLPTSERNNIFRLRPGNQTNIFRSVHGSQSIRSSRQLFGPDPWVRPLGRRFEGGAWSWFTEGHYSDRVLVEPANGDAKQGISPASYQIYQTIEETKNEVRAGGRQILDEQISHGQLQSFVGGPSRGQDRRFGMVRYYRHPSNTSWTVAIGELNQFWVDASDLDPVERSAVDLYIGGR